MELREIIKTYRTEHNLSQREFAARCGDVSNGYISIIENDYNPHTGKPPRPSVDKLVSIAKGMGLTLEDLLQMMGRTVMVPPSEVQSDPGPAGLFAGRTGEPLSFGPDILAIIDKAIKDAIPYSPPTVMVPVVGSVRCGPGGLAYQEYQGTEPADVANPKDYFYLRAEGDSMLPDIRPGDLVLVHIQPEVDNGDLAVVVIDGEEGTLKKFMRKGDTVVLQSFNQQYPPRVFVGDEINTIKIAGRVVETKRKW